MPASSGIVSSVMSTPKTGYPASMRAASIASRRDHARTGLGQRGDQIAVRATRST